MRDVGESGVAGVAQLAEHPPCKRGSEMLTTRVSAERRAQTFQVASKRAV
jgi:hypothetical protein